MHENSNPIQTALSFDAVSDTANLLGVAVDALADLSVNNPRVFGILVDATVIRLTYHNKQ